MFRTNWRNREFWAWWWQTIWSPRLRSAATVGTFVLLGAAGVFSADRLSSAKASPSNVMVLETTVARTVTREVAGHDRVVTVNVVRRVRGPRVPPRTVVVTSRHVVTKPHITTRTVVDKRTVTRLRTRLVTRTVTHTATQTTPPVTVAGPTVTVTQTLPAQTVTTTMTVTVTPGHGH